jgi:hypothetical protein
MPIAWNNAVKSTGRLTVYADVTLQNTIWNSLFDAGIDEFNRLSKAHKFGVILQGSKDPPVAGRGGANVSVAAANGQISFEYDGVEERIAFDGTRMHGRTRQVQRHDRIEKAYVFLPAQPLINTPKGRRTVGPEVLKLIAVHEFVHACGLTDAEHTTEDLFQANPNVDYGTSGAAGDRAMGRRGNDTVWMPPLFLSNTTAQRIKKTWV